MFGPDGEVFYYMNNTNVILNARFSLFETELFPVSVPRSIKGVFGKMW